LLIENISDTQLPLPTTKQAGAVLEAAGKWYLVCCILINKRVPRFANIYIGWIGY